MSTPTRRKIDVRLARAAVEEVLHCAPDTCDHCREKLDEYEKAARGNRERREVQRPTASWVADLMGCWVESRGGELPYGRMGRVFSPLVRRHGLRQVRAAWVGYLSEREGKVYAQPEDFAASYGLYASKYAVEVGEDGFTMKPIPDEPSA